MPRSKSFFCAGCLEIASHVLHEVDLDTTARQLGGLNGDLLSALHTNQQQKEDQSQQKGAKYSLN